MLALKTLPAANGSRNMYEMWEPRSFSAFSMRDKWRAYLSCARNCMKRMLDDWLSSVIVLMLGKNLNLQVSFHPPHAAPILNEWIKFDDVNYLNMVWTETMVLQSESVSSSAELENSLLTTTTLSARVIPALIKSSRLDHVMGGNIPHTNNKQQTTNNQSYIRKLQ